MYYIQHDLEGSLQNVRKKCKKVTFWLGILYPIIIIIGVFEC